MNRVDENEESINKTSDNLEKISAYDNFEVALIHLTGALVGLLADVSRSLAVIADALTERNKDHE
jgi:hypothetical protein